MGSRWQALLVEPKRLPKMRPARRKKNQGNNNAKQTPMKGHAALPKREGFEWVACKIAWLIKQDVAQPAPNNHAQDPIEKQVLKVSHRHPRALRVKANLPASQQVKRGKGKQVHQAIPMNG